jgi:hypothetical protein
MARLFLDQREIAPPQAGFASLEEIVKHIELSHLPGNSVIRQIHIDGLPITSGEFTNNPAHLFANVNEREKIEVFTGTIWEVARDSVNEAVQYLDRIRALIPSVSSGFQVLPTSESFINLKQLCEGFYWISLLLDRLQTTFRINPETVSIRDINAREHQRRFVSLMKQMVEAQEREDYILISDILDFEVLPSVPVWKEMLEKFGEKICNSQ